MAKKTEKKTKKSTLKKKSKKKEKAPRVAVEVPGLPTQMNKPLPPMTFGDRMKRVGSILKMGMRKVIFRRTFTLTLALLLIGFGVWQSLRHKAQVAFDASMTVSPIDQQVQFALTGTPIKFKKQYRSGSLYILPFEIDSFDRMSTRAEDYEVMLQGKTQLLSEDLRAKLMLFGSTGYGVVLVDGPYTGEPMNIYIQSNASILGSLDGDVADLSVDGAVDSEGIEEEDELEPQGNIFIDGNKLPIYSDMVVGTFNPTADNVQEVKGLTFNSSATEIYEVAITGTDIKNVDAAIRKIKKTRESLLDTLYSYEDRLYDDDELSELDIQKILAADKIAKTAQGTQEDIQLIRSLLTQAGVETEDSEDSSSTDGVKDASELTDEERDAALKKSVDLSRFEKSGGSSGMTTFEALNQIRTSLMTLSYQEDVLKYKKEALKELADKQEETVTTVQTFSIITPF